MTTTPAQEQGFDKGSFSHELAVMQRVYRELEELDFPTRARVLDYISRRFTSLEQKDTYDKMAQASKEQLVGLARGSLQGARSV